MKIAVAASFYPFRRSAIDELVASLVAALQACPGIVAEPLRLPFVQGDVATWEGAAARTMLIELFNVDRVVALDFPATLLRGPAMTVWRIEPGNAPASDFLTTAETAAMTRAAALFAAAPMIRDALGERCGRRATLLPVPTTPEGWQDAAAVLAG